MADGGNNYFADPNRIQSGTREIDQISTFVQNMLEDFTNGAYATAGWTGTSDSLAKQLIPADQKDRQGTTDTARALTQAIVGIARGTETNLKNILATQQGNLDAIHQSAPPATGGGEGDAGGHTHH
jgi:hypothetical protein